MARSIVAGQTPETKPEIGTIYPGLDGLRAIAFILVFLTHYELVAWFPGGVNFFFVLSGFLITGILWDMKDRPGRARTFYVRRSLRVFPLYYGVLLLAILAYPMMRWDWNVLWLAWPLYLGNLLRVFRGFHVTAETIRAGDANLISLSHSSVFVPMGHFWSLCVEEQFYLLWPFIVWRTASRRVLMVVSGAVAVSFPILRILLHHVSPHKWGIPPFLYSSCQFDGLLLGALLALAWRGQHRGELLRISRYAFPGLTAIGAVYAVTVSHGNLRYFLHGSGSPSWFDWWGLALLNLYGALLVLRALQPGSLVYRAFTLRPMRWLGKISYGAYVFHDIPHSMYRHLIVHFAPRWPLAYRHVDLATTMVAFASTLVIAQVSYRTFETYFLNLKEKWAPSRLPA